MYPLILYLDCEGAGLDAVISLDALLLPLIVRDVPRELELRVAHAAGAAPGRGGRGCSAPVTLLKLNNHIIQTNILLPLHRPRYSPPSLPRLQSFLSELGVVF